MGLRNLSINKLGITINLARTGQDFADGDSFCVQGPLRRAVGIGRLSLHEALHRTPADAWRPTAQDALGLGVVRKVPASD